METIKKFIKSLTLDDWERIIWFLIGLTLLATFMLSVENALVTDAFIALIKYICK